MLLKKISHNFSQFFFPGHTMAGICVTTSLGHKMTTGSWIKETVSVYVVTPLTFAGFHTVYMLLLVIILVNGKKAVGKSPGTGSQHLF